MGLGELGDLVGLVGLNGRIVGSLGSPSKGGKERGREMKASKQKGWFEKNYQFIGDAKLCVFFVVL